MKWSRQYRLVQENGVFTEYKDAVSYSLGSLRVAIFHAKNPELRVMENSAAYEQFEDPWELFVGVALDTSAVQMSASIAHYIFGSQAEAEATAEQYMTMLAAGHTYLHDPELE